MSQPRAITIAGGGLAGLSLGIMLRQCGVPVELHEAGAYPRNKVCGEFISGRGQDILQSLEVFDGLGKKVSPVKTVALFSESDCLKEMELPKPAFAIRRLDLDQHLATRFHELGGGLKTNSRIAALHDVPGFVVATGRRPQTYSGGHRFFGLKAHFSGISLSADLELHFGRDSYVGLLKLPNGETNVCGLFRSRKTVPNLLETWQAKLGGNPGSPLHSRMQSATVLEGTFCSIAALDVGGLRPRFHEDYFSAGDSMMMIPPFTGNGMSIAFETASLALQPLLAFCESGNWELARRNLFESYQGTFGKRMRRASILQGLMFNQTVQKTAINLLKWRPDLFKFVFEWTR